MALFKLALLFGSFVTYSYAAPQAFASSLDNVYQLSAFSPPVLGSGNQGNITSTWGLSVDDTASGHMQKMTGFGAAVTDATVTAFNSLNAKMRQQLLNDLFSPTEGINFNFMRHTIASSDLSSFPYSYDDGKADPKLNSFNLLAPGRAMTTLLADMKAVNPAIKLLGSVWSPPGWMKLNGVLEGNTTNNNVNLSYGAAYGAYFVKYIQKFASRGVPVDAITIQNEPLNSNAGFPTTYVSAEDSTYLIQNYVGPALKAANLSTEILAYDHNTDVPSYPQTVLNGAPSYVKSVAWHCYASNNNWNVLSQFHANNTNVTQYMTECWLSPFTSWYQSPYFIIGPVQNWAAGAIAWTLGTTTNFGPHLPGGCTTCRGIIEVDVAAGRYIKTLDYYLMGQFSKFIQCGSTALATTGSYDFGNGAAVQVVAFLNADGSRTLVIYNGFGNDVYVTVTFKAGETWSGPVYLYSVTTWLLPASTT